MLDVCEHLLWGRGWQVLDHVLGIQTAGASVDGTEGVLEIITALSGETRAQVFVSLASSVPKSALPPWPADANRETNHRRSQRGPKEPPEFLENITILCFEKRFSNQNSVIRLKSNILAPSKLLGWLRCYATETNPSNRTCVQELDIRMEQLYRTGQNNLAVFIRCF